MANDQVVPMNGKTAEAIVQSTKITAYARLVQLLGIPICVSIASFVLMNLVTLREDMARVNTRGETTKDEILRIGTAVDKINDLIMSREPTRYTKEDAARDFSARDARMNGLEHRIENLELLKARPN
jgi:hypothetical protein